MRRNFFFSFISNGFKFFSGIVIFFIFARIFSVGEFGDIAYALVISYIFGLIVDFGYPIYIPKESASNKGHINDLIARAMTTKMLLIVFALALLVGAHKLGLVSGDFTVLLIFGLSAGMMSLATLYLLPFRSLNQFQVESKYTMFYHVMLSLFVIAVILMNANIFWVSVAYMASRTIFCLISFNNFRRVFKYSWQVSRDHLTDLKKVAPYAVHAIIATLILQVDTLILRNYADSEQIGIYQAGMKFVVGASLLISIFYEVLLPKFTLAISGPRQDFIDLVCYYNKVIIGLGVSFALILYWQAELVIFIAYGERLMELSRYIGLFAIFIFLRFFGVTYNTLLTCSGNQSKRALILAVTFCFIVVLESYLIPLYQIRGALYSLIAGNILLYCLTMIVTYKEFNTLFLFKRKQL